MKIQYKNRTYKQTNWRCCDCALIVWKLGLRPYHYCFPSVKMNCRGHAFKQDLFIDEIFKL